MVKVDTYRLVKLFWSARTVVLDIERRERSNESLELLQEQTDVFLRSLHVIQKVLLEKHSKSNTVKLTCIPNNLPVSWARMILYQLQNLVIYQLLRTKYLGQIEGPNTKIPCCIHWCNAAV